MEKVETRVKFHDLERHHTPLKDGLMAAMDRVLHKGGFILGPEVKEFEAAWAAFTGARYVVGCANGTDAIVLALLAAGIKPGDEVITVSHTFIATVEAIVSIGAVPVFADIEKETGLIDPSRVPALITARTRAIVPVHIYGQVAAMDELKEIATRHNLTIIEDAAQAHGARYNGKGAGTIGECGCFSFFPGKNLGALGDAGALVTNNEELARRASALRDHGRAGSKKYEHTILGWNMRMDALQAAFLKVKLPELRRWNERRVQVATRYDAAFSSLSSVRPLLVRSGREHCYHLYVVRTPHRDEMRSFLSSKGIESGVHYPTPCHLQPAMQSYTLRTPLPETESLSRECLSLPIHGEMRDDEVNEVIAALNAWDPSTQEIRSSRV